MDNDALRTAVMTLCDTLCRKFNEGPPLLGSVMFSVGPSHDRDDNPLPLLVTLETCGFEVPMTNTVDCEGLDLREIRGRLTTFGRYLLSEAANANPLQEDELRQAIETFNYARLLVRPHILDIQTFRNREGAGIDVIVEVRSKTHHRHSRLTLKSCRRRHRNSFEALRRVITRHIDKAHRDLLNQIA